MVFNQLTKYLNKYDPIKKRGSGISIKDLRFLENLGIVNLIKLPLKSGKQPKNPNAFELTIFGRDIIRQYNNQEISQGEILAKIKHDMVGVKSQITDIENMLKSLKGQLDSMETFLNKYKPKMERQRKMVDITEHELIELLEIAQNTANRDDKMGLLYKTEIYFAIISDKTPLADDTISKRLYNLYEKNLLDLQMGPDHGGRSVQSPSGKQFSWGNLVE